MGSRLVYPRTDGGPQGAFVYARATEPDEPKAGIAFDDGLLLDVPINDELLSKHKQEGEWRTVTGTPLKDHEVSVCMPPDYFVC